MRKERLSYLASIVISILLLFMAVTGRSVFFYVSVGVAALFILDPYVVLCGYFVSSLSGSFFATSNIGASRLFSVLSIVSLLIYIFKSKSNGTPNNRFFLLGGVLSVYSFFSCALSVTGYLTPFYGIIQCLLVTCLMISVKLDSRLLLNTLIINSTIVLLVVVAQAYMNPIVLLEERLSFEDVNSNDFAMMSAQLGAVMIGSVFYANNRYLRAFLAIAFASSAVIIVLSGSRSALLGLLAATMFVLLTGLKADKKRNILIISLFVIGGIVSVRFLSQINSPILDRFNADSVMESGGTGRLPVMKLIVSQVIFRYPLFGVGMGGQNIMALGIPKQCHNIVVDPVSQIGIVGYVLFLLFIVPLLSRAYKSLKISKYAIIPLALTIAAIVNGIGEVVFYEKFFWNDIALCGMIGFSLFRSREYSNISSNKK